jgi:hypothetical protein
MLEMRSETQGGLHKIGRYFCVSLIKKGGIFTNFIYYENIFSDSLLFYTYGRIDKQTGRI